MINFLLGLAMCSAASAVVFGIIFFLAGPQGRD
jgi:hypothetical protein